MLLAAIAAPAAASSGLAACPAKKFAGGCFHCVSVHAMRLLRTDDLGR